ncbi:MAG: thiamine diphosphokinase [Firmicutes bacterium]|nr:thiamine diphosphokinase [Bacillota bacterium]
MKSCVIISGGEFCPLPESEKSKYIIACDRGCMYTAEQGIVPDLIIGDFDSYDGELPADVEILTFPAEKDDTDTMIALKTAIERGFDEVSVYCGFGGRLDHLYANFQTAVYGAEHGVICRFVDGCNEVVAIKNGELMLPEREGWSLSVFAVSDECRGVNITGAKYELNDAVLTNTFPLGVSNQWKAGREAVTISVAEGILLIIMSKM